MDKLERIKNQIKDLRVCVFVFLVIEVAFVLIFSAFCLIEMDYMRGRIQELNEKMKSAENFQNETEMKYDEIIEKYKDLIDRENSMQLSAIEANSDPVYLGKFKVTAYCCEKYAHICGTGTGITASGLPVEPGLVAVDTSVIPLGSIVIFDGEEHIAADTGGLINGNRLDLALNTHSEALNFGVQYKEVYVIYPETENL